MIAIMMDTLSEAKQVKKKKKKREIVDSTRMKKTNLQ